MNKKEYKTTLSTPVFPITPPFIEHDKEFGKESDTIFYGNEIDLESLGAYVKYLDLSGAKVITTNPKISSYNLLSLSEIIQINRIIIETFSGNVIVAVPPSNTKASKRFIEELDALTSEHQDRVMYMFTYPEEYYNDESVIEYFFELADHSKKPCLFYGAPMKQASSGYEIDFDANLINKIAGHPKIVGMQENSSHMAKSIETIRDVDTEEFSIISAEFSMNLFNMQKHEGACSFVAGAGALFPEMALNFYNENTSDDFVRNLINCETDLFQSFKELGFRLGLLVAIQEMGLYRKAIRSPLPQISSIDRDVVKRKVKELSSSLKAQLV